MAYQDDGNSLTISPKGWALEDIERQAIIEALKLENWVQKDAAPLLAISSRVLNYKIKTLDIPWRELRDADRVSSKQYPSRVIPVPRTFDD